MQASSLTQSVEVDCLAGPTVVDTAFAAVMPDPKHDDLKHPVVPEKSAAASRPPAIAGV